MNLFQAIILAIVEGLTEFLPVSSTGHLILVSSFFNIENLEFVKSYEIIIQLGAVLSVVFIYLDKLKKNPMLLKPVAISFLPSAVLGIIAYPFIKSYLLESPLVVIISLFIGGIILMFVERFIKPAKINSLDKIDNKLALFIGLGQTLSLIPGVSRSASSIVTALIFRVDKKTAVEFSFLLAIPTIFAATAYDLIKSYDEVLQGNLIILIIGFIVSFITAYISVKWFLRFVTNNSFFLFGVYRVVLSIIVYLFLFL